MNAERRALAAEILAAAREHDAGQEDRLDRYRVLEPETAELLAFLVRATGARDVLEIGTSIGYSTLWLADAAEDVGGTLVSVEVEVEPQRSERARANLERAGLSAELRVQDAAETLQASADAEWDLVFLDAERPAYAGYWPDVLRTLRPGGVLAVDNVLSHPDEVAGLLALISAEPAVTSTLVPIGAGLELALRR
jgi:predicted O-methyltransferase YrrM